jgi:hypothetical protein
VVGDIDECCHARYDLVKLKTVEKFIVAVVADHEISISNMGKSVALIKTLSAEILAPDRQDNRRRLARFCLCQRPIHQRLSDTGTLNRAVQIQFLQFNSARPVGWHVFKRALESQLAIGDHLAVPFGHAKNVAAVAERSRKCLSRFVAVEKLGKIVLRIKIAKRIYKGFACQLSEVRRFVQTRRAIGDIGQSGSPT